MINMYKTKFQINNSRFEYGLSYFGGVLFISLTDKEDKNKTNNTIAFTTFSNNKALFDGGAIYSMGAGFEIISCIFIGNRAQQYGSDILMRSKNISP